VPSLLFFQFTTTECLHTVGKINTCFLACGINSAVTVSFTFDHRRHRFVRERCKSCFTKNYQNTMKKLMLTIASLLFVSVMAVNAQVNTDTTSVSDQPSVSDDQSNYTRDMELIQSSEVPASLRSTLQGTEYTGWEEGKVYRNASTNEYLIVIGEEDAKVYRFDANGTKIETPAPAEDSGSGSTPSPTESTPSESPAAPAPSGSTGTTPAPEPTPAPSK
jgi:hypothetical protein